MIHDFIRYKMEFIDGRVSRDLIGRCDEGHLKPYARRLEKELDSFFDPDDGLHHKVTVLKSTNNAIAGVRIDMLDNTQNARQTFSANADIPQNIENLLLKQHSQWLYFQRELRIYDARTVFVFKPNEKLHWFESQALVDADNILGEILQMRGEGR